MSTTEREDMRNLQDDFLADIRVRSFAERYGQSFPLFGDGSPSFDEFRKYVYLGWKNRIEAFLKD